MTNPTPHGQVPEALIDLIDAYAETRHRCGGIYNAKTEAARKAVIEALSGVQALSAAPAGWKLVPENATDAMVFAGCTVDNATHMKIENSILKTKVWAAMLEAAPKAAPGELHDHQILAITTAYEQGVGKGRQAHESGKEIANPYGTGYRCDLAWQYGYKEGKEQAERIAKAAPTPPAEQQAKDNYIKLLADCRDAFPVPEHGSPIENEWIAAVGSHEAVPAYLQAVAKQQAITPETGNSVSAQGAAITSESGTPPTEPQAQPGAVDRTGCTAGTDEECTRRGCATSCPAHQAAHKATPAWEHHARKLTQWLHCMSHNDSYFGEPAGLVKQVTGELNRLIGAAPQQEPFAWESTTPGYIKYITQARYEKFSPNVQRWYKPYKCSSCAAPQQEAQEPVAWQGVHDQTDLYYTKPLQADVRPLYTTPQPAPAPLSDDVVKDAARWRLVETASSEVTLRLHNLRPDRRAQYIDAAIAAQGGKDA